MKTYAEAKGERLFDWNKFLNRARRFDEDWEYARALSNNWVTCACGNQCSIIPRDEDGAPYDKLLGRLGMDFHAAISIRRRKRALEILKKIEVRSAQLIKEITEAQNAAS